MRAASINLAINSIMISRVASTASPPRRPVAHRQLSPDRTFLWRCNRSPASSISVESRSSARLGNIESPEQVAGLSFDIRNLGVERPGWVGIDQEGGRVARLRSPFTEWPPMAALGRSDNVALAKKFAAALAAELTAVGISLDYAPVLDIHTNPKNLVIGDRALGEKPDVVARLGTAIIEELQRAGVAACGKHFPGSRRHRGRFPCRAADGGTSA